MKKDTVYLCVKCEQINTTEECPICCQAGKPIPKNTANKALWDENIDRMIAWCQAGRFIPEVG